MRHQDAAYPSVGLQSGLGERPRSQRAVLAYPGSINPQEHPTATLSSGDVGSLGDKIWCLADLIGCTRAAGNANVYPLYK